MVYSAALTFIIANFY
ncbi:hypothetical protein R4R77_004101 [Citrobacter amalonaticus]